MNLNLSANVVSGVRGRRAFTLIEMLVVIAIIALIAGLIVGLAPIANKKMREAKAQGGLQAMITYIDAYKRAKGFYPPSNTNDPICVQNSLFYELTGTILTNFPAANTLLSITQERFTQGNPGPMTPNDFGGISSFLNASADPNEVKNFCGPSLKSDQYALVPVIAGGTGSFTVMGLVIPGPRGPVGSPNNLELPTTGLPYINPWHYNSANPTNNPDSYDLWIDVIWGGKTNRISNWSKDPQPL